MRGRKATPTHLKLLNGNPGHRPLNKDEPIPEGNLFDPPAWMNDSQKEVWRHAIANAPKGLLRRLDGSILSAWVVAEDLHREATEKVNQFGMVVKAPSGVPIQSPFLSIINRQAEIKMKAISELGFSPASRTRVKVQGAGEGAKTNRFAENAAKSRA